MECLYVPNLERTSLQVRISGDEAHHIRVLRLRQGENIVLSNGMGYRVIATFIGWEGEGARFAIQEEWPEEKLWERLILAPAMLHSRSRWDFLLEKSVELSVSEILPLRTERTILKGFNVTRSKAKLIAAMKQSQRAFLPKLHNPQSIRQALAILAPDVERMIVADPSGQVPESIPSLSRIALFIGPEGGWSARELQEFTMHPQVTLWSFGSTRLRSETAAVVALSVVLYQKLLEKGKRKDVSH